jgi:uncharacterized RDD family membrane protein YckC
MNYYVPATWKRFLAKILDLIFIWILWTPIFMQAPRDADGWIELTLGLATLVFLFPIFAESACIYFFHTTPGKWIFHLQVEPANLRDSAKAPSAWAGHALLRSVLSYLTLFVSGLLFATMFFRYDRRHWADLLAETRVVSKDPSKTPPLRPILGLLLVLGGLFGGMASFSDQILSVEVEDGKIYIPDPLSFDFQLEEDGE